jgi:hypothetical protein
MECPFHAGTEAVTTCVQCQTPICPLCASETNQIHLCLNCYRARVNELSTGLGGPSARQVKERQKAESKIALGGRKKKGEAPAPAPEIKPTFELGTEASLWEKEEITPQSALDKAVPIGAAVVGAEALLETPPSKKELARMKKEEAKQLKLEKKQAKEAAKKAPEVPVAPAPEEIVAPGEPFEMPPSKKELARMKKEEAKQLKLEKKQAKEAAKKAPEVPVAPEQMMAPPAPEPAPFFETPLDRPSYTPPPPGPVYAPPEAAPVSQPSFAPPPEAPAYTPQPSPPPEMPIEFAPEAPSGGVKFPKPEERLEPLPPREDTGDEGAQREIGPPEGFFD